jgi:hypothetical protein
MGMQGSGGDVPWVQIDNLEFIRLAMVHLHALGHRTIAYVGGPTASWSNMQRLDALRTIVAQSADTELINLGSFQPYVSGGIAAADLVIASDATAVLAYNDLVAYGLLDRFRQRGIRVPGGHQRRRRGQPPHVRTHRSLTEQRRDPTGELRARRRHGAQPRAAPRLAAGSPPRPVVPARSQTVDRSGQPKPTSVHVCCISSAVQPGRHQELLGTDV